MSPSEPGHARIDLHSAGRGSEPHRRFLIPHRLGYRWRHFNHRVALWSFRLARRGDTHPWADHLVAGAAGGPFSTGRLGTAEQPRLKFGYQRVEADTPDRIGAARVSIHTTLGSSGVDSGTFEIDRRELGLDEYDGVAALLVGFAFDTDVDQLRHFPSRYDPAHGYTTRGLGLDVAVSDLEQRRLSLDYWIRFGFGAAMDRPHLNEALVDARVGADLHVALVGYSDRPLHTGSVDYVFEGDEPDIAVDRPVSSVHPDDTSTTIEGTPGAPPGLMGIRGFNFDLTPDRSCEWNRGWPMGDEFRGERGGHPEYGPPGYYLRELTVDLARRWYDRDTGRGVFSLEGFASNATHSIPFHPFRCRFSGRMIWVQTEHAAPPIRFDADFPPRHRAFALDEME